MSYEPIVLYFSLHYFLQSLDEEFLQIKSHVSLFFGIKLESGGRLNKKDGLTRYGDSHVKDKTS